MFHSIKPEQEEQEEQERVYNYNNNNDNKLAMQNPQASSRITTTEKTLIHFLKSIPVKHANKE